MKLKAVNKRAQRILFKWAEFCRYQETQGIKLTTRDFHIYIGEKSVTEWARKKNAPTARALCRAERNADATHRDLYPEQYDDNGRLIPAQRQYGIRK